MADRKSFLLRVDEQVLDAMKRWADDDLRSLNGQIEFVLRRALAGAGRWKKDAAATSSGSSPEPPSPQSD
ncbi:MAG: hypothetical protein FJW40_03665 [Acidobacteria bacterium]|nr:hypothetical protein [Acidobacteriota bacterium]